MADLPKSGLTKKQRYAQLHASLKTQRSSHDTQWRDIADYISPMRARFTLSQNNRGDRRNQKIIDMTGTYAARTCASGMHSSITSPARPWFRLSTPDTELAEYGPAKSWLHEVTQLMASVFQRSNLYQSLPLLYLDMCVFGTAAMGVEDDDEHIVRFIPFPIGSYCLSTDAKRRVRVFTREFHMTVRQLIDRFGKDKVSKRVMGLVNTNTVEEPIEVTHVILPNDDYDERRLGSEYKKFASCYFETGTSDPGEPSFLEEGGFDEFPVLAPRWSVTAEDVYGTDCPGIMALGDIKQLQLGEKRWFQGLDKGLTPPLIAPPGMRAIALSMIPGTVSYGTESQNATARPLIEVNPNFLQFLTAKQTEVRGRVNEAFFVNLFLLLASLEDRGDRTATEIMERKEEKLVALGPTLENVNQDVLDQLIDITFGKLLAAGRIPDPPPEMEGMPLRVDYISIMAQAQQSLGIGNQERFTGYVINIAKETENPAVLDKVDWDQLIDEYAMAAGVSPKVVVPDDKVAEIRAARAQSEQAAQEAALLKEAGQGAKAMSEADTSGKNALTDMVGAGAAA